MKKSSVIAVAALIVTAAIWGLSYSAQSEAMESMPPLFFVFLRYIIGTAILLPVIFCRKNRTSVNKKLITGGIACGVCLAGGEILQQFGLLYTSAGKAGFLTALYVIMIPLIGIFIRKKSHWMIWTAAIISAAGSFLLCADKTFHSFGNPGDILMLICALFFAFQFIFIAKFAPDADAFQLAAIQFFTVAVLSGTAVPFAGEKCSLQGIISGWLPLFYCGVIAIGIACTVQVAAQKYVLPATASIVLSTASVFAVFWGWLLLDEHYSLQNLIGCVLIFAAVVMVQLQSPEEKQKQQP